MNELDAFLTPMSLASSSSSSGASATPAPWPMPLGFVENRTPEQKADYRKATAAVKMFGAYHKPPVDDPDLDRSDRVAIFAKFAAHCNTKNMPIGMPSRAQIIDYKITRIDTWTAELVEAYARSSGTLSDGANVARRLRGDPVHPPPRTQRARRAMLVGTSLLSAPDRVGAEAAVAATVVPSSSDTSSPPRRSTKRSFDDADGVAHTPDLTRIRALEAQLAERDVQISERDATIAARDVTIAELKVTQESLFAIIRNHKP